MNKKSILIGLGVLALAGVGVFIWNKKRTKSKSDSSDSSVSTDETTKTESTAESKQTPVSRSKEEQTELQKIIQKTCGSTKFDNPKDFEKCLNEQTKKYDLQKTSEKKEGKQTPENKPTQPNVINEKPVSEIPEPPSSPEPPIAEKKELVTRKEKRRACGIKPVFKGKKRDLWNKCVAEGGIASFDGDFDDFTNYYLDVQGQTFSEFENSLDLDLDL